MTRVGHGHGHGDGHGPGTGSGEQDQIRGSEADAGIGDGGDGSSTLGGGSGARVTSVCAMSTALAPRPTQNIFHATETARSICLSRSFARAVPTAPRLRSTDKCGVSHIPALPR